MGFLSCSSDGRLMWWSELKNIPDTNIRKELLPFVNEVVKKEVYTCVTPTFLQTLCHHNNGTLPEKVFVAGVDTDACVLKIATDLFEAGIRPIVLTKYCFSGGGAERHNAGLLCLERLVGEKQLLRFDISSAKDIAAI